MHSIIHSPFFFSEVAVHPDLLIPLELVVVVVVAVLEVLVQAHFGGYHASRGSLALECVLMLRIGCRVRRRHPASSAFS